MKHHCIGLIMTLILGLLITPLCADAQPPTRVPLIGKLSLFSPPSEAERQQSPFLEGLRDLGYIEGQTITSVSRYADGQDARLPALATELVQLQVDLIVAMGGDWWSEQPRKRPAPYPLSWPLVRIELVINLKTAQVLGLTILPLLLFQADEVIRYACHDPWQRKVGFSAHGSKGCCDAVWYQVTTKLRHVHNVRDIKVIDHLVRPLQDAGVDRRGGLVGSAARHIQPAGAWRGTGPGTGASPGERRCA